MKRAQVVAVAAVATVACCCGAPWAWFTAPTRQFPVGADIRRLGLEPERRSVGRNWEAPARFYWAPQTREPFLAYCRRKGRNPAHFTGSLALCRPGSALDGVELPVVDGRIAYGPGQPWGDARLDEDTRVLRASHLGKMLQTTGNDWRIYNDHNHFIEPEQPRFTGRVEVALGAFSFAELQVENDVIRSSRRRVHISLN